MRPNPQWDASFHDRAVNDIFNAYIRESSETVRHQIPRIPLETLLTGFTTNDPINGNALTRRDLANFKSSVLIFRYGEFLQPPSAMHPIDSPITSLSDIKQFASRRQEPNRRVLIFATLVSPIAPTDPLILLYTVPIGRENVVIDFSNRSCNSLSYVSETEFTVCEAGQTRRYRALLVFVPNAN